MRISDTVCASPIICAAAIGATSNAKTASRMPLIRGARPPCPRVSFAPDVEHNTAFVFPGQGSQYAGMGKDVAEAYPAARRVFDDIDAALGFPISRLCFEGPEDQLKLTENTQPALLTVSVAASEVLREAGVSPDFVAGHSLGEYSALVAGGSLRFADAVRLVRKRGQYMQEAVPQGVGAM